MTRPDMRQTLRRLPDHLTSKTIVIAGEADSLTPVASHREICKYMPHQAAVLCLLDGVGHLSTIEEPGVIRQMFRVWLSSDWLSSEEIPWAERETSDPFDI